jgi:hypothetical protein
MRIMFAVSSHQASVISLMAGFTNNISSGGNIYDTGGDDRNSVNHIKRYLIMRRTGQ